MNYRELAREVVREQERVNERNKESFDTHFPYSDAHAFGIMAAGGAVIVGITKPALYVTAVSVLGASLIPFGAAAVIVGSVGVGIKVVKHKIKQREN